jgi:hypothetical protein
LSDLLDEFLSAVIAKKAPRLIIQAPPQHGKSELASRRFPAYVLGKYPHLRLIASSYGVSLAFDLSRDVQTITDGEPYHRLSRRWQYLGSMRFAVLLRARLTTSALSGITALIAPQVWMVR